MTLSGRLALTVLAVSILSYGMSGAIFAQEVPASSIPPLSVETDQELYTQGNTVTISGHVKDYDASNVVTLRVLDANGNIIAIAQLTPDGNGDYSTEVIASGPLWKPAGDYQVLVNYGAQGADVTFEFTGGDGGAPPPPPPPPEPEPEPEPESLNQNQNQSLNQNHNVVQVLN